MKNKSVELFIYATDNGIVRTKFSKVKKDLKYFPKTEEV